MKDPDYAGKLQLSLFPESARTLQYFEVWALAALYWPGPEVKHAVDVAELESGFRSAAHNTDGEDSRGIWQINVAPGAHPQLAEWNLFDPQVCAYFAARIWRSSGWRAWYHSAVALNLPLDPP